MGTHISWTDETYNPIVGCSRISPGCLNCYASTAAASPRLQRFPQYQAVRDWDGKVEFVESQLNKPFGWRRPKKIFVCSMSDIFHANVPDDWRHRIFAVIAANSHHTFQVLTKRPDIALCYFNQFGLSQKIKDAGNLVCKPELPLSNVHLGVTVENQEMANRRIEFLYNTPAVVRWLSVEPLLGAIDFSRWEGRDYSIFPIETVPNGVGIDQIIVGGESGTNYRPMQVEWLESIAAWCDFNNVPLFVKQDSAYHSGKQGRISDDLWARKEFPSVKS